MSLGRVIYVASCWLMGIICGVGYIALELFGTRDPAVVETMKSTTMQLMETSTNLYNVKLGMSLLMAIMFIAFGVINLLVLRSRGKGHWPPLSIHIANIIFAGTSFAIAYLYLFSGPMFFTGVPFVGFILAALFRLRGSHQ